MRIFVFTLVALSAAGCARVYRTTIDEQDGRLAKQRSVEVQLDATGINVGALAHTSAGVAHHAGSQGSGLAGIVALTNLSPKTGYGTFGDAWADGLYGALRRQCHGRLGNMQIVREQRDLGYASFDGVRVVGNCEGEMK